MIMENFNFYFILIEICGLSFLILLIYIILLKKDKNKLLDYIKYLKTSNRVLKEKLNEQRKNNDPTLELLLESLDYVKTSYEKKYGHKIGSGMSTTQENNSKNHFLYVMSYQFFKAELSALENSSTGDRVWDKIVSQLNALIDNYRVIPEKEFDILIKEKLQLEIERHQINNNNQHFSQSIDSSKTNPEQNNHSTASNTDKSNLFGDERKGEINRLKSQVSSQFEDIWNLQLQLSNQASKTEDSTISQISTDFDAISHKLKDAELCISMLEQDIAYAERKNSHLEEKLELSKAEKSDMEKTSSSISIPKEVDQQIDQLNIEVSSKNDEILNLQQQLDESTINYKKEIDKREDLITRFSQESKEMIMLISDLEEQLESSND
jgi:hypothetical protein